jgi:adenine-specific DNA methylase
MTKRLIEYNLPLAAISEASARENIRHGYLSTLHIWWARRPLSSSRATAFAALIDDPDPDSSEERAELLERPSVFHCEDQAGYDVSDGIGPTGTCARIRYIEVKARARSGPSMFVQRVEEGTALHAKF